jgi:hypothetical protein
MALIPCSAPGCNYFTPEEALDFSSVMAMIYHPQQAHQAVPQDPAPLRARIDEHTRPEAQRNMTEHEFKFFSREWGRYRRATTITGHLLVDELWNMMAPELRQLSFDQGDVETLNTGDLMMTRIKTLVVTVQHAAVHTVAPHGAQQYPEESTKGFAA